jgi:type II secretory ATPase GspE/PulE/Tfp pilus assembly ATPase PilB-like protein
MAMRQLRVESFRLASTLQAVIAQRLVQRLCPECREPVQAQGSVSALLGFDPGAVVYAAAGCSACGDTGYAGQVAVFEAIHADPAMRRLINDGGDEAILASHAYVRAPNLGSAARTLVREGDDHARRGRPDFARIRARNYLALAADCPLSGERFAAIVVQLVRASACDAGCCGFKSRRSPHFLPPA